eukprot:scaffold124638_cov33-Tisochrysis_lutea.AAC.3
MESIPMRSRPLSVEPLSTYGIFRAQAQSTRSAVLLPWTVDWGSTTANDSGLDLASRASSALVHLPSRSLDVMDIYGHAQSKSIASNVLKVGCCQRTLGDFDSPSLSLLAPSMVPLSTLPQPPSERAKSH